MCAGLPKILRVEPESILKASVMFHKYTAAFLPLLFLFSNASFSQKATPLFWLGNEPYYEDEFLYAFKKNRQLASSALSEEDIASYFDLYVNFRLKVKEAKALGYDKKSAFEQEMEGYRKQLAQPYLAQSKINEEIVQEAYERTLEEVEASHILIEVPAGAAPADTLQAFNTLTMVKNRADNGESFADLAKQYSQDPSARQNSGYLGFFGAFQMVYPFEQAAFTTPQGQVSEPFRTSFGYHIVKVHSKRQALGSIKLAHIFFRASADSALARTKAYEVKSRLNNGEDWSSLVQQYSDESSNKSQGGELPWLTFRQLPPAFYAAAEKLIAPGQISDPLKSPNGWHILKLIEKRPVPPLAEVRGMIESRIAADDRTSSRNNQTIDSLMTKLQASVNLENKKMALEQIDGRILEGDWSYDASATRLGNALVQTTDSLLTVEDFYSYLERNQQKRTDVEVGSYVETLWSLFLLESLESIELGQLYKSNADYRYLYNEYHDGTLLFEIMNEKVWQRANTDTLGLKTYFDDQSGSYMWSERAETLVIEGKKDVLQSLASSSADTLLLLKRYQAVTPESVSGVIDELKRQFPSGDSVIVYATGSKVFTDVVSSAVSGQPFRFVAVQNDSGRNQIEWLTRSKSTVEQYFNELDPLSLKVSNKLLEKDSNEFPLENWREGIHFKDDGAFSRVVFIKRVLEPGQQRLGEVKGKVVSDYQEYLEKNWVASLREKYPLKVNSKEWKNMAKTLHEE